MRVGKTEFGATYIEKLIEGALVKEVDFEGLPYLATWEDRYDLIQEAQRAHDIAKERTEDGSY